MALPLAVAWAVTVGATAIGGYTWYVTNPVGTFMSAEQSTALDNFNREVNGLHVHQRLEAAFANARPGIEACARTFAEAANDLIEFCEELRANTQLMSNYGGVTSYGHRAATSNMIYEAHHGLDPSDWSKRNILQFTTTGYQSFLKASDMFVAGSGYVEGRGPDARSDGRTLWNGTAPPPEDGLTWALDDDFVIPGYINYRQYATWTRTGGWSAGAPTGGSLSYGYAEIYSLEESGGYFYPYGVIYNAANDADRYQHFTDKGYPQPEVADARDSDGYLWGGQRGATKGVSEGWSVFAPLAPGATANPDIDDTGSGPGAGGIVGTGRDNLSWTQSTHGWDMDLVKAVCYKNLLNYYVSIISGQCYWLGSFDAESLTGYQTSTDRGLTTLENILKLATDRYSLFDDQNLFVLERGWADPEATRTADGPTWDLDRVRTIFQTNMFRTWDVGGGRGGVIKRRALLNEDNWIFSKAFEILGLLEALPLEGLDQPNFLAIRNFLSDVQAEKGRCLRALRCIRDEWENNVEAELDAIAAELQAIADRYSTVLTIDVGEGVRQQQEYILTDLNQLIADHDRLLNLHYTRNPDKLFFKEQCYLLSFVQQIASFKKEYIDVYKRSWLMPYPGNHAWGDRGFEVDVPTYLSDHEELRNYFDDTMEDAHGNTRTDSLKIKKLLPYVGYTADYAEKYGVQEYNASLLIDGDPYGFINKLLMSQFQTPLMNIPHNVLSLLQPYVRLFKVEYDENGNESDTEITFNSVRDGPDSLGGTEAYLFKNNRLRNTGVGLKEFRFTYDGNNPFGIKKSIKGTLKIFSNTFDELLIERTSPGGNRYRYVDLALKTFNNDSGQMREVVRENIELSKLNFRLKAMVGWSPPDNAILQRMNLSESEANSLRESLFDTIVTLNLVPTVHDFEIDELGRVNFNIDYLAWIEEFYDQAQFNVFSNAEISARRIMRELTMEYYQEKCDRDANTALEEIKKQYAIQADDDLAEAISTLMDKMIRLDRIYYINISTEAIKDFVSLGPFSEQTTIGQFEGMGSLKESVGRQIGILDDTQGTYVENLRGAISDSMDVYRQRNRADDWAENHRAVASALVHLNPKKAVLSYFYISDLVDTLLANIEEELIEIHEELRAASRNRAAAGAINHDDLESKLEEYRDYEKIFRKIRIILGPLELTNPQGDNGFVNLGDIPISVKYFFEWLTSTMLAKEEVFYSLSGFMNDLINDLINKFLNNNLCFSYNIKQFVRLNQASITGPQDIEYRNNPSRNIEGGFVKDPITVAYQNNGIVRTYVDDNTVLERPLLRDKGTPSARVRTAARDEVNYMVYFVGQTFPANTLRGNKAADEGIGIYHYQIGRDRGLVKDIKLSKTSTPGLQEVRFEQQGYQGLEQLRVVYDAKIEGYANTNTFPGSYIFVDPFGYSPSLGNIEGSDYDLTKYGVGGYYMIIRSTHIFGPGTAKSTIEAKWVNQLYERESANNETVDEYYGTEDETGIDCSRFLDRISAATRRRD